MSGVFLPQSQIQKFKMNCSRVKNFLNPVIKAGLLAAANPVVMHAKAEHSRPATAEERAAHPDRRFYTWSGHLVQSIRAGKFLPYKDGAALEILAGDPENPYASFVEFGTSTARAFPFMRPALEAKAQEVFAILGAAVSAAIKAGL
jgi:HK97 gp10 family phage protein